MDREGGVPVGPSNEHAERTRDEARLARVHADQPPQALAGAVSHELNNLLTGMFAGIDFLQLSLGVRIDADVARDLAELREAAERIRALSVHLQIVAGGEDQAVALGLVAPAPRTAPACPPAARIGPRRTRILVIDDEPSLVELVVQALAAHEVVACASPRAALARVCAGETFDAILCDLEMPDLDGEQVFTVLSVVAPALADRVVFTTGGAFTPRLGAFLQRHGGPRLAKPFTLHSLRDALAAVILAHTS